MAIIMPARYRGAYPGNTTALELRDLKLHQQSEIAH